MTENYQIAAGFAQEAFEEACREADNEETFGKLDAIDIARFALNAKNEAECRYGVFLTLTLDADWNWKFS